MLYKNMDKVILINKRLKVLQHNLDVVKCNIKNRVFKIEAMYRSYCFDNMLNEKGDYHEIYNEISNIMISKIEGEIQKLIAKLNKL